MSTELNKAIAALEKEGFEHCPDGSFHKSTGFYGFQSIGIKAIEAIVASQGADRAATAAEPVAWQERQARRLNRATGVVSEWSGWYECKPRSRSDPLAYTDPDDAIPREWRPLFAAPRPSQAAPRAEPSTRALEFAEYLAKGAERLLEAMNNEDDARMAMEEDADDTAGLEIAFDAAQSMRGEFATGLRSSVYEFRKRAEKVAALSQGAAQPEPQKNQYLALQALSDSGQAMENMDDARRYRWLRSNPQWLGWDHDFRPDEVEREIDAAMASSANPPL